MIEVPAGTELPINLAPSATDSKIIAALKALILRSRIRVGKIARQARNTLQRMQGEEPEPIGAVNYHSVKRWARYLKKVSATFPASPHVHPRQKRTA
jgi:hypothetical protein